MVKHRSSKATWPLLSNKCSHHPRRHNNSSSSSSSSNNSKGGLNNHNLVTLQYLNRTACIGTSLTYTVKDHTTVRHMARTTQLNHLDSRRLSCPMLHMRHPMVLLLSNSSSNNNSNIVTSKEPVSHSLLKVTMRPTVNRKPTTIFRPGINLKLVNTHLLKPDKPPFRPIIRHNRTVQALLTLQINRSPISRVLLASNVTTPSQLSSLNKVNTLRVLDSQALHSELVRAPET